MWWRRVWLTLWAIWLVLVVGFVAIALMLATGGHY
jgi:hypothetical protein